jgi:outer membrane protein TolC
MIRFIFSTKILNLIEGSAMQINIGNKILLISILFLNIFFAANAQTITNPDSALTKILQEFEGTQLTLSEAQKHALEKATSVRRAEADYLSAKGTLRRERGGFDPEFYFSLNYQDLEEPTASFFAGADVLKTERTTSQTGFRWKSPIGTNLELGLNTTRLKTNSDFAFLNPEYNAFGSLSFRQPLLNGFMASSRKELEVAESRYEAAKARYDQEVIGVEAAVEQVYWNLYSAERDYAVQKLTRDRAVAFLKEAELRHDAGLVGPNQVANAKTFMAQQELLLIDRREQLDSQSDQLTVLIGVRPDEGFTRFRPIDEPPRNFDVASVDEMIEKAKVSNLELQAAQKEIDAANTLVDAASWETLPRVDLVGSFVSNGLGGDSQNVIFGGDTLRSSTNGSFGDVLNQVFKRDYPGWSIGIELSLPIGLRPGLGEQDRLEAQAMNVEQRYIELSRILEQQVRAAHRELSNGGDRLKAATVGVEAAQEQVRIGMIEFQNGRITAFELVRLSEDFAVAQQRYSEALVKTVNAVALLKQLTSGKF